MAYIVLTLIGLLAVIIVKNEWPEAKQGLFIVKVLLAAMVGYLVVEYRTRSNFFLKEVDLEDLALKDIGMFFAMLLGMASKYLLDLIGEKKRRRIAFKKWQFLKPFLVAPITFSAILSQVPENISVFMLFLISYQNGFFWHTLLYKAGPEQE
jgi:H+/Cl- antiporter ClcA